MTFVHSFRFIPERNNGIHDVTCPKAMINRDSMRLTFAVRSAPVPAFLFLFRNTRAAPGIASAPYMRAPTHHAARKWHMSSWGTVHVCTRVRTLAAAAEYNSGNTMELGQSCFDARLRNFHLLRRESFSHVFSLLVFLLTIPEVSVLLNDIQNIRISLCRRK